MSDGTFSAVTDLLDTNQGEINCIKPNVVNFYFWAKSGDDKLLMFFFLIFRIKWVLSFHENRL